MIKGNEEIADALSVFHDGSISDGSHLPGKPDLFVQIRYLAERIDPSFTGFRVYFAEGTIYRFQAWSDEDVLPEEVRGLPKIIALDLEILSAKSDDGAVVVACLSHSDDFPSQGGELRIASTGLKVCDESGLEYSLDELGVVCKGYWDDWAQKNEKARQDKK